jgi:hypothetical protein
VIDLGFDTEAPELEGIDGIRVRDDVIGTWQHRHQRR